MHNTMVNLLRCLDCGSFVAGDTCPHCASSRVRATKLGALATAVSSSAFAMTLMACYGVGPGYHNLGSSELTGPTYVGQDGDSGKPSCSLEEFLDARGCKEDAGQQGSEDAASDAAQDAGCDAGDAAIGDAAIDAGDAATDAACVGSGS